MTNKEGMTNRAFPAPQRGLSLGGPRLSPPLRTSLAVQEFVRGNITLPQASTLAGMESADFIDLLSGLWSTGAEANPRISVVVPVYNEEENLPILHERLCQVLSAVGSFEIVFVDDGSRDGSVTVITALQRHDPRVKLVRFSRNFGHQAALSAGIDHACGDAVILMDADLQDPPELLPELLAKWEAGYHVVYAVRQKREEGMFKRVSAGLFYRILRRVSDVDIPVDAGDFCLMDRKVADVLRQLPERNRFLRGLRSWAGFKQVGVPYKRPARHAGEVKYTLRKMVNLASNGVMAFTSLPLRLASFLGVLTATAGIGYLGVALFTRFVNGSTIRGWTSIVAVVLIVGGAQLMVTGVLGAYIARIYEETKGRPMYVLADALDQVDPTLAESMSVHQHQE
jgi:polyisoprenyl-phosphate glycosyltransferase